MSDFTRTIDFDYALIDVKYQWIQKQDDEDEFDILLYGMYIGGVNVTDLLDNRHLEITEQIKQEILTEKNYKL